MKKKYLLTIAAALIVLAGVFIFITRLRTANAPAPRNIPESAGVTTYGNALSPAPLSVAASSTVSGARDARVAASSSQQTVTVSAAGSIYSVSMASGGTVFDAMTALETMSQFSFTYHTYAGLGAFVDSINGQANGGGSTWFFYINGKESSVGISSATLKPGDSVEWKFEKNDSL